MKNLFLASILLLASAIALPMANAETRENEIANCEFELGRLAVATAARWDDDTSISIGKNFSNITFNENERGLTVYSSGPTLQVGLNGTCNDTKNVGQGIGQGVVRAIENLEKRRGPHDHSITYIKIYCGRAFDEVKARWPQN